MTAFQHLYWGYAIEYPDFWFQRQIQDTDFFVATLDALEPNFDGPDAGQIQIRGEWNWARQNVEPLWNQHIGKVAPLLGAIAIGSAPWKIGEAEGFESEIVLPKKDNNRLWAGILAHDFCILHFMVIHPREVRAQFEPEATRIISSLRFPKSIAGANLSPEGLPIPPNFNPIDPQLVLNDISEKADWRAFSGEAEVGALQSFYLRELTAQNWEIVEYVPLSDVTELGFAKYKIRKDNQELTLGLLPSEKVNLNPGQTQGNIVYKIKSL